MIPLFREKGNRNGIWLGKDIGLSGRRRLWRSFIKI